MSVGPKELHLNLTPMVDTFTLILVFLIKSYSSAGDLMSVGKNIVLPSSSSRAVPEPSLQVSITSEAIGVEGKLVADSRAALQGNDMLIPGLLGALQKQVEKSRFISRYNKNVKFEGKAVIQGDKKIPFRLLEKVMYTCGQVGYTSLALAVNQKE